jgi:hypothetical protein
MGTAGSGSCTAAVSIAELVQRRPCRRGLATFRRPPMHRRQMDQPASGLPKHVIVLQLDA